MSVGAMDSANTDADGHAISGRGDQNPKGRELDAGYTEDALRSFEREMERLAERRGFTPEQGYMWKVDDGGGVPIQGRKESRPKEETKDSLKGSAEQESIQKGDTLSNSSDVGAERTSLNLNEYFRSEQEEKARSGILGKHVGLLFEDLSVVRETRVNPVAPNAMLSTLDMVSPVAIIMFFIGPVIRRLFPSDKDTYVLKDLTGLVKDGEMCLVLGRAGSGCTTFLKTTGLVHTDIKRIEGKMELAGIGMKEFIERFRSEVLYNPDKDGHISVLTVGQTLDFALRFRTPGRRVFGLSKSRFRRRVLNMLLRIFKIQKIENSVVGNEIMRGISGGERRRLTIAEMLSAGNAFSCWDNLTNGLDSSTAYEVVKALRILTDVTNTTTIVSLCQASEQIYSLFDKLMILDHGLMIYFGSASQACSYFESLGYMRSPTESTPDFLMNIVDVNTRKFNPTFDVKSIPVDPVSLQQTFLNSYLFKKLKDEIAEYRSQASLIAKKDEFVRAVLDSKSKYVSKRSTFTVSFVKQVLILARRNLLVMKQNKSDMIFGIGIMIFCSIVIGIGFFQMSVDARGLFIRGSLLLLSVLFNALQYFSDMVEIYQNRFIVERHKNYRFYCASAEKLAYFLSTLPRMLVRSLLYIVIVYPMTGLKFGDFLAVLSFFVIMILNSMSALSIFMCIGSSCRTFALASRVASVVIFMMVLLSGFPVPYRFVPSALVWLFTINPVQCGFSNYMIMEFRYLSGVRCSSDDLVPNGPGYDDDRYKFCSLPGAESGNAGVDGLEYIKILYGIVESSYWINVLILVASTVVFLALTCVITEMVSYGGSTSSVVLYKRPSKKEKGLNLVLSRKRDIAIRKLLESQGLAQHNEDFGSFNEIQSSLTRGSYNREFSDNKLGNEATPSGDVSLNVEDSTYWNGAHPSNVDNADLYRCGLTWRNVIYTVNVVGKDVVLTNDISGYAKPGQLTALMGASGAGKTTFLDVICGRKTMGAVSGEVKLAGRPLFPKDHDKYAYCEQLDVLKDTSTVRESLRFSSYLRQSFSVAKAEKNRYVEELLSLLELEPLADAIIGNSMIDIGINPGKRKLVSIGIELASRPSMAILLDEPTTGLDTKSADDIIRLLKKLASTGLVVICTIHQPNTTIFEQFDNILLMMSGGKTAYFGPIGKNSSTVLEYFQSRGAVYDQRMNPPEFIIDVVEPGTSIEGGRIDWAKEWIESENCRKVISDLEQMSGFSVDQKNVHNDPTLSQTGNSSSDEKRNFHSDKQHAKGRKKRLTHTKVPVPWIEQIKIVTMRELLSLWRTPDYTTTRVFNHVVSAIMNYLAFSNMDNTLAGVQSRMFSMFQLVAFLPLIVPPTLLRFFKARMAYSREESVGTYTRSVFALSLVLSEIPLSIFCATLYVLVFYLPSGLKNDASHFFYFFAVVNILELFSVTLGMAISTVAPSVYLASKFIPCLFLVFHLYSGITAPYSTLAAVVKYTLYWINPFRWMMGALMESEISDISIRCDPSEFSKFNPPPGLTCGEYITPYIQRSGVGYIDNPDSTEDCNFCSMSSGNEFLSSWGDLSSSYISRDIIIFFIYLIVNTLLIILGTKYIRYGRR